MFFKLKNFSAHSFGLLQILMYIFVAKSVNGTDPKKDIDYCQCQGPEGTKAVHILCETSEAVNQLNISHHCTEVVLDLEDGYQDRFVIIQNEIRKEFAVEHGVGDLIMLERHVTLERIAKKAAAFCLDSSLAGVHVHLVSTHVCHNITGYPFVSKLSSSVPLNEPLDNKNGPKEIQTIVNMLKSHLSDGVKRLKIRKSGDFISFESDFGRMDLAAQLVSSQSLYVGCSILQKKYHAPKYLLRMVCYYAPGLNKSKTLFIHGKPCELCPNGYRCKENLCQRIEQTINPESSFKPTIYSTETSEIGKTNHFFETKHSSFITLTETVTINDAIEIPKELHNKCGEHKIQFLFIIWMATTLVSLL